MFIYLQLIIVQIPLESAPKPKINPLIHGIYLIIIQEKYQDKCILKNVV